MSHVNGIYNFQFWASSTISVPKPAPCLPHSSLCSALWSAELKSSTLCVRKPRTTPRCRLWDSYPASLWLSRTPLPPRSWEVRFAACAVSFALCVHNVSEHATTGAILCFFFVCVCVHFVRLTLYALMHSMRARASRLLVEGERIVLGPMMSKHTYTHKYIHLCSHACAFCMSWGS